jgi:hypothetical protein
MGGIPRRQRRLAVYLDGARREIGRGRWSAVFEESPFERVVRSYRRPGYVLEPLSITWDAVAFTLRGPRTAIVCIPRDALAGFFDDLDAGRLDESIRAFIASPESGRLLVSADQTSEPRLFDQLASPDAIVRPERGPRLGRWGGRGSAGVDTRRRKHQQRGRFPRMAVVVAVLALVVVALIAVAARSGPTRHVAVATTTVVATPTVDPCVVGDWVQTAGTSFFGFTGTTERVSTSGGAGWTLSVQPDGTAAEDATSSAPYVGTTARGEQLIQQFTGQLRYKLTAAGNTEHFTQADMSKFSWSAQINGVAQRVDSTTTAASASYTCDGTTLTDVYDDGATTTWTHR